MYGKRTQTADPKQQRTLITWKQTDIGAQQRFCYNIPLHWMTVAVRPHGKWSVYNVASVRHASEVCAIEAATASWCCQTETNIPNIPEWLFVLAAEARVVSSLPIQCARAHI